MTQNANDVEIANQGFAAFRQDLNDVLEDITTLHSGDTAPTTTYANQWWYETDTDKLYIRNEDNDAWIEILTLDQTNDKLASLGAATLNADTVNELTSGSGVTVDSLLIKDKEIGTTAAPVENIQLKGINGGQIGGRRNLIINGAMNVAQRGTSETGITSSAYSACDRFKPNIVNAGTWTISQSSDAPDGFATSLKFDCTTADTSLGVSDRFRLDYYIEGQDVQHLQKGSASAKSLTISFYVKTNKTGTYVCELNDADNTRAYSQTYTVDSANTWEKKTIVFSGDTSGVLDNDNNSSLQVHWWIASGTDFTSGTTPTGWGTRINANRAAGLNVNIADSTINDWYITGVQLEVGSTATEFEHRSYGEELALCQRYYTKFAFPQTTPFFPSHRQTGNTVRSAVTTPVPMRTTPTINASGQPFLSYNWDSSSTLLIDDGTSLTVIGSSLDANRFTISNPDVTGVGTNVGSIFAYSGDLECDSEL